MDARTTSFARGFGLARLARIASLVVVAALAGCGGSVELLSNMNERDANDVIAALSESDIKVQKVPAKDGAVNLTVDQSNVARAITVLSAEGMPREHRATMGDVFRKEGLISSPLEERARYLWALSQELSETISQIDGVLRARVHVVLPERSTGGDPPLPSSAGVFVKHQRNMNLDDSVPQIKRLVASSIPGLSPEKVTVVLVASGSTLPASAAMAAAKPVRTASVSPWQATAYGLTALSVLCMGGFGAWRTFGKQRGLQAQDEDEAAETA
ncbi:MAG TPA: type III secretion inner membrane ring lipoprotein SctJ [Ramlibacter sp.]|uniref:type III secretion system inner membrane ring lipoprotein SctJ n=1 Tax=Ramlibacter sp. TaxID=1917967 RepID=UPI002BD73E49|nr:type III secretion inner membrane ring lipoprotein SctJ [Ramlibacter sp.]HVZ45019.1 type III secretion inner membrane ring lipoprotein SctJ [Ramlibacter sp.]